MTPSVPTVALAADTPAALPAEPAVAPPKGAAVRFIGNGRAYFWLLARGGVLLMITLGIYRFWLQTDIRRFLWANTDIAGETLEYTGTARELLLGFLIATAILLPLNTFFFLIALNLGVLGQISTPLAFLVLALLGHYAVYRARRYRLTRTVFRGVRFHQSGSAWRYGVMALAWWTLIVLTLGLAYPFAQASLERYKMRHTHFGDLAGRFEGSATQLLGRGALMWFLVMGPFVMAVYSGYRAFDPNKLLPVALNSNTMSSLEIFIALIGLFGFAAGSIAWAILSAIVLYPAFQAMMLRWWTAGLRFGDMQAKSSLRTGTLYRVYLRFLGWSLLFSLLAIVIAFVCFVLYGLLTAARPDEIGELAGAVTLIGGYVVIALGYSTIYQAVVKLGIWRATAESVELTDIAVLDRVVARGEPSSAFGEGLADALNVGGL